MKKPASWFGTLLYTVLCVGLAFSVAEPFTRRILLTRDFLYFHLTPSRFPRYQLLPFYQEAGVTIRDSRREYYPRPQREGNVAFVGDSVTFGTSADRDTFVERIQRSQGLFNAYNYGVPGYGITEIHSIMHEVLQAKAYDGVVYLFNTNDPKPTMSWRLALLGHPADRLTTVDAYEGFKGSVELFIKDHLKSVAFLMLALDPRATRKPLRTRRQISDEMLTVNQIDEQAKSAAVAQEHWAQGRMFSDPALMDRVAGMLTEMNLWVKSRGAFFLVALHHDYLAVKEADGTFQAALSAACEKAGVEYLDTFELYRMHYTEPGFYWDPHHLGKAGNAHLSGFLTQALLDRFQRQSHDAPR